MVHVCFNTLLNFQSCRTRCRQLTHSQQCNREMQHFWNIYTPKAVQKSLARSLACLLSLFWLRWHIHCHENPLDRDAFHSLITRRWHDLDVTPLRLSIKIFPPSSASSVSYIDDEKIHSKVKLAHIYTSCCFVTAMLFLSFFSIFIRLPIFWYMNFNI